MSASEPNCRNHECKLKEMQAEIELLRKNAERWRVLIKYRQLRSSAGYVVVAIDDRCTPGQAENVADRLIAEDGRE
ncbi:hypothetical protein [Pseudoxanthomonas kalamensis]|uniref:hypothetical protein n=1 Tax=Pseudoxanthomonas kalamensis TaxID=289483 RepID=UPI001390FF36|nr:hypothetical protein [Pseudoxanthomonas kalamensis]